MKYDYSIGRVDSDSIYRLREVDYRLAAVMLRGFHLAKPLTPVAWRVTSTVRTEREQAELLRRGATRTLDSAHLHGRAVDVAALSADRKVYIVKPDPYRVLADCVAQAVLEIGLTAPDVFWGGNWQKLRDYGHFELLLPEVTYPIG